MKQPARHRPAAKTAKQATAPAAKQTANKKTKERNSGAALPAANSATVTPHGCGCCGDGNHSSHTAKPLANSVLADAAPAPLNAIRLRGVRQNNLKNFDIDIPLGKLIVVTGLSGSGKSSLVFDTVHAEGQRRYVETFSPYTRQFLEMLPRPQVDAAENVRPSIALEQGNTVKTSRSSVGTITELCDYFKVWFAHQSELIDPASGKPVENNTAVSIAKDALKKYRGRQLLLCAHLRRPQALEWKSLVTPLVKQGFTRVIIDGAVHRLDTPETLALLETATAKKQASTAAPSPAKKAQRSAQGATAKAKGQIAAKADNGTAGNADATPLTTVDEDTLVVVVDRLTANTDAATQARFTEAALTVLRLGHGFIDLYEQPDAAKSARPQATSAKQSASATAQAQRDDTATTAKAAPRVRYLERFTEGLRSPLTGERFAPAVPNLFSFNSPLGACPQCRGFGRIIKLDPDLIIPDKSKTLDQGAIAAFCGEVFSHSLEDLRRGAKTWKEKIPFDVPYCDLTPSQLDFIWHGDPAFKDSYATDPSDWDSYWYGIDGFFKWIESNTYKMHLRVFLSKFRSYVTCPQCDGTRLTTAANNWRWMGYRLPDLYLLPVCDLLPLLREKALPQIDAAKLSPAHPARLALEGILTRLNYLEAVGLGYLHLDRASRTLSGGESQRVNLTACLGTSLVETLFVLDEPSIGLHARDVDRLIGILRTLRDQGNTVLVVEHDQSVIAAADHVIEIGPKAGAEGGQIVYNGASSGLALAKDSLSAKYLNGEKTVETPAARRPVAKNNPPRLSLKGVSLHNLNKLDVTLPLHRFVALSGVSGSGKSTLLKHGLHQGLLARRGRMQENAAAIRTVSNLDAIGEIVLVDQSPLSRTPRSNAAIMTGAWARVRELYAATDQAQRQGFTPSHFSFNNEAGRCQHCEGLGYVEVQMQFLSDIYTPCPVCEGKRFRQEVLDIRLEGKSVSDLLAMSAVQALAFFAGDKKITAALSGLLDVGLGYLPLGQPVNSLSGGESQRLKLLKFLGSLKKREIPALILLDEPTTGLHRDDVGRLLAVLQKLVDAGHSLVVIEHHQDVLKAADWIIELGPEAGARGGKITFAGLPEDLAKLPVCRSATAPYLAAALQESAAVTAAIMPGSEAKAKSVNDARSATAPLQTEATRANPADAIALSAASGAKGAAPLTAAPATPFAAAAIAENIATAASPVTTTAPAAAATPDALVIRGAREHNLKNIDARIAHRQLTVVTGVSGSGKSTLAFDIIFAEGQRRFLESMSSYARQFVEQLSRPQVDAIYGIAPTVAIEQRVTHGSRKSTVATITEVAQYLRLLYARIGTQYSPQSLQPVVSLSPEALRKHLEAHLASSAAQKANAIYLCAPLIRSRKGHHEPLANWAKAHGYPFLRCDGTLVATDTFKKLDRYKEHSIELALPLRLTRKEALAKGTALQAKLGEALRLGKGSCFVLAGDTVLGWLSTERTDPVSGEAFPELDPKHFSWNSMQGWCETCRGYGLIEDWMKDREEFAQLKARRDARVGEPCPECHGARLNRIARSVRIPLKAGWEKATASHVAVATQNTSPKAQKRSKPQRNRLQRVTLGTLLSQRLAVAATISLPELLALPPAFVLAALHELKLSAHQGVIATAIVPEIEERLRFMDQVGLGYLGLDRATNTLSGGEAQRIRLAAQLGSQLSGVLYVLDEPSIGLHARDNAALIDTLHTLRNKGNTLVVVEHDEDTMRAADQIIDLGPGAGRYGGEVLASGSCEELLANERSLTGRYLRDGIAHPLRGSYRPLPPQGNVTADARIASAKAAAKKTAAKSTPRTPAKQIAPAQSAEAPSALQPPKQKRRKAGSAAAIAEEFAHQAAEQTQTAQWLTLSAPHLRNLRGDDLYLPLGRLNVVCGPSGAGKSTLINDLLQAVLDVALTGKTRTDAVEWEKLPANHPLRLRFGSAATGGLALQEATDSDAPLPTAGGGARSPRSGKTAATATKALAVKPSAASRKSKAGRNAAGDAHPSYLTPALFGSLTGAASLNAVIAVDQSPIGKTPRSTPATYIGAWDIIRRIFADAPEAKWRGFAAGTFSFNTAGGRCEHCQGAGRIRLEMAFLPEAYEVCPHCNGKRFGPEVLGVTWRGKNIAEVLDMSIEEAAAFFESHNRLHALLALMAETGLGYLHLGQSSPTLSGGEAQRLKLVRELSQGLPTWKDQRRGVSRNNIYLLEEPTIGLHLSDCQRLIELLHRLVDQGHTVVVIEHHLDLIAEADYVVELGPDGGEHGGKILYQGALRGLLGQKNSPTAPFLREKLQC